jgi:hypothetical protein
MAPAIGALKAIASPAPAPAASSALRQASRCGKSTICATTAPISTLGPLPSTSPEPIACGISCPGPTEDGIGIGYGTLYLRCDHQA